MLRQLKNTFCFFLITLVVSSGIAPSVYAQENITPTVYCVGGAGTPPCAPLPTDGDDDDEDEPETSVEPSEEVEVTTAPIASINPDPTVEPCENEDNSVQHYGGKHKKKFGHGGGGFFEMFFEFLKKLIEYLIGGGQMPTIPDPGTTPDPDPDPGTEPDPDPGEQPCNEEPEPSNAPEPTVEPDATDAPQPTIAPSTAVPTTAPTTGTQPTISSAATTAPQPSTTTSACTAPAVTELQDQDFDDSQLPWKRNGAPKVVINFETKNVSAAFRVHMEKGVAAWNRSACLDTRLVDTCQAGTNCVTVQAPLPESQVGADGNFDAVESGGFTTGGSITIRDGMSEGEQLNVTIHEMGHAVGLRHRLAQGVLMNGDTYDNVFDPDDIDMQNLQVLYGTQQ